MRYGFSLFAILLLLFGAGPALANSDNAEPTAGMQVRSNRTLTPAEKAEKKARKACKIEICDILAVRCSLLQKEGKPYVVELDMAPKVTFENGKAVSAEVNWGEVSAPMLIYPILYAGTGLDNSSNVLGPEVVRMVNEFTGKKCAEVRRELPSNQPN